MRSCVLTDSRLYLCFFVGLVPNRVPCVLVLGLHLICAFGILDWASGVRRAIPNFWDVWCGCGVWACAYGTSAVVIWHPGVRHATCIFIVRRRGVLRGWCMRRRMSAVGRTFQPRMLTLSECRVTIWSVQRVQIVSLPCAPCSRRGAEVCRMPTLVCFTGEPQALCAWHQLEHHE